MEFGMKIFLIFILIGVSAFFSMSEIALAASRKIKLRLLADNGNKNASKILDLQDNPGIFFTVVQIGLNAVAILGGIIGEGILNPYIINFLSNYQSISEKRVGTIASVFSFIFPDTNMSILQELIKFL